MLYNTYLLQKIGLTGNIEHNNKLARTCYTPENETIAQKIVFGYKGSN
jgi:hypothetical protein